ncbi:triacylglycerol esterase/lipase EstA (alpha/beta hydrolase family) [Saccharomonospora amisosensis]|uniref:Triacylglycerol esterase/lipase EstA (Alpha/beta hydrolase family) n=1 Tax=Saccharomonospora amisosensis TaxID=1128677 RepID=A0A7X5UPI9_9PSEU|nr:alpha/beta fold hydrolase [Saccharomonospora amisosensis]NIJ11414.1 triacylglycerol esterase/lipase EstA (alpha/beta hydrolase family) [Saccharomonospora amisosensis]
MRRLLVLLLATATALVPTTAPAAAAETGPPQRYFAAALAYSLAHPDAIPPGANDFSCEPSQQHPNPVVLVHGTFENRYDNWAALSPLLAEQGYCVFALNYGGAEGNPIQGTGDIATSAQELAAFVSEVLAATGAGRVDLVGHSQGGMMPRYYLKHLDGSSRVDKLIALTPSNHGTTLFGLANLLALFPPDLVDLFCAACRQQVAGSDFVTELNSGGETDPAVDYTVIATRYDEVVTPYTSSFLEQAPNVDNLLLQDFCPADFTEHVGISYNEAAMRLTLNALDPENAVQPSC